MRRAGRVVLAVVAFGFGALCYAYLTLPDVRVLRTGNPRTTAFIELRAAQARARGEELRRRQRWVGYSRISPSLKRAVSTPLEMTVMRSAGTPASSSTLARGCDTVVIAAAA